MERGLQAYIELIKDTQDAYGTWPPGEVITAGEIGRLTRQGVFVHTGTLEQRGIHDIGIKESAQNPIDLDTSGSVAKTAEATGKTDKEISEIASASASFTWKFSGDASASLKVDHVKTYEVQDENVLRDAMRTALREGRIHPDEIVVTWVFSGGSGVLATSTKESAETEVDGELKIGPREVVLVEIGGKLHVIRSEGTETTREATVAPLTPFYRALVFRRNRNWYTFWRSTLEPEQGIEGLRADIPDVDDSDDDEILGARPSEALQPGAVAASG